MIGPSHNLLCLCYWVVALQVVTSGASREQPVELEEDENHEEPAAKRAGKRAHNRAGSRIRIAVRGQQRRRSADVAFGRCTEVHHQVANGNTEGYSSGTSTSFLEFGSLRIYGKCGKDEYIWICLETWTI